MVDYNKAIDNPAKVFRNEPEGVLKAQDLSAEQKIEILERWRTDELEREVSTEEAMPEGKAPHLLRRVCLALQTLKPDIDITREHHGPTKHGL